MSHKPHTCRQVIFILKKKLIVYFISGSHEWVQLCRVPLSVDRLHDVSAVHRVVIVRMSLTIIAP